MKKLVLITLLATFSISASAAPSAERSANTEKEQLSQLCEAALESREALQTRAKELGVGVRVLKRVTCNDVRILDLVNMQGKEKMELIASAQ